MVVKFDGFSEEERMKMLDRASMMFAEFIDHFWEEEQYDLEADQFNDILVKHGLARREAFDPANPEHKRGTDSSEGEALESGDPIFILTEDGKAMLRRGRDIEVQLITRARKDPE